MESSSKDLREFKSSIFNYFMNRDKHFLIYNTLYSKLYLLNKEDWDYLRTLNSSSNRFASQKLNLFFQHGLVVESDTEEKALMYHIIRSVIYENRLSVTIIPTEACNFRCTYCFEPHDDNFMTDETEKSIVKFFKRNIHGNKSVQIEWFGGEPLLQKDRVLRIMRSVQQSCQKSGVPFFASMVTNGYLLDLDLFEELVDSGVYYYQITIDGPEIIHNNQRKYVNGGPTFDRVYGNILKIKEGSRHNHFHIVIRSNLSKPDFDQYKNFIEVVRPIFGNDKRFLFSCEPIYDWGGETVKSLKNTMFDKRSQLTDQLLQDKNFSSMYMFDSIDSLSSRRCIAGKSHGFMINYDGNIYKCGMSIDNEKFTRLGSIDQNGSMVINEANNARFLELGKEYDKCNGCCWLPQCLICNCTLSHARGKDMRCLKDFSGDAYLNETVWNSFLQKKHIDLCN